MSLWVALGHAFTETRNVLEAVQAYETATEVSPADCRGWTGLGQLFALLDNLPMAITYFHRACDARYVSPASSQSSIRTLHAASLASALLLYVAWPHLRGLSGARGFSLSDVS